jgi:hypothetical protein
VTWRYNEIYNHQVEGIMCIFGGSAYWYIYGNVWHDGMTGVSRILEAQDGVEGPFYFYNNTMVNVPMGCRTANGGSYAAGTVARNNIYWNVAFGGGIPDNDYDFANTTMGEAHGIDNGANPFVNSSGQNYHIVTNSASNLPRGKGVTLPSPYNMDFDGNLLTTPFDIGAYAAVSGGSSVADTNPPTVSLTAPATSATVSNSVAMSANASDNTGVTSVSFVVDGNIVGTDTAAPYNFNWNSLSTANGTHSISAIATDYSGNSATSSVVTVTLANPPPDTTAPTVSITAPISGSVVSNSVALTASATDNVGGTGVASVSFTVDGYAAGTVSNAPYTVVWSSSAVTNGSHVVQATAKDLAGNQASSSTVTITVSNPAITVASGLVGFWKFDETTGTIASDSSGNGNTASLVGDAAHAPGIFNEALSLDGGTGYARVPSAPALEQVSGPVSISAWVKFNSNVTYAANSMQTIMRKVVNENDNSAPPYSAYDLVVQDFGGGTFKARMGVARASDSARGVSGWGNAHTYGSWYHFVGVYDGTTVYLYVNGVLEISAAFSGSLLQTTAPLCIGRYGTADEPVNGLVDEVRLYNRALSATDVQTLYNTATPPAPFGLKILPN